MKDSQLCWLVAMLFLLASFFKDGTTGILLIFLGFVGIIFSVMFTLFEHKLNRVEFELKKLEMEILIDINDKLTKLVNKRK